MQSSRSNEQYTCVQRSTCVLIWREQTVFKQRLVSVDHQVTWEFLKELCTVWTSPHVIQSTGWYDAILWYCMIKGTIPNSWVFWSGFCFHYKSPGFSRSGSYNLCYFCGLGPESNHKENTAWLKTISLAWQNIFFWHLFVYDHFRFPFPISVIL